MVVGPVACVVAAVVVVAVAVPPVHTGAFVPWPLTIIRVGVAEPQVVPVVVPVACPAVPVWQV
jgi:hypothetical protein